MDTILANAAQLNDVLLVTDEGEYDSTALQVLQALRKFQTPDHTVLLTVSSFVLDISNANNATSF